MKINACDLMPFLTFVSLGQTPDSDHGASETRVKSGGGLGNLTVAVLRRGGERLCPILH